MFGEGFSGDMLGGCLGDCDFDLATTMWYSGSFLRAKG